MIDLVSLSIGLVVGALMVGAGVAYMLRKGDRDVPARFKRFVPALVAALVMSAASAGPLLAQETPVPLEIPVNVIFSETNNWLATFAPIAAIGIGIAIALAVLGYLGKMITSAFKG